MSRGYRALLVHFGLARFFMAIPTENEGTGERGERRERRTESAARQSAFLRDRIGFVMFSAGSPLGAARPQTCAKEPLALWTLFIWVAAWVRFTRRRALGYNEDLSGLRLSRAHHTFLPKCFMLDHACCLPHERQTGRLAICSVPVPPWVEIAIRAFSNRRCGYRAFLVHFGGARLFMAIPTGNEETRERGERSRRRDRVRFCVTALAL